MFACDLKQSHFNPHGSTVDIPMSSISYLVAYGCFFSIFDWKTVLVMIIPFHISLVLLGFLTNFILLKLLVDSKFKHLVRLTPM